MKKLFLVLFAISVTQIASAGVAVQDDTVKALRALTPPVIDGHMDDACWAGAKWQPIDQVWIPWGEKMQPFDFTGKYKVVWSPETDRIYFLVHVVDDVLVKGYKYPMEGYYNWDVVELFFDEDASGGDHKLNQNAFAYHITAGNDTDEFEALDLGPSWAIMNYSDHLNCVIENDGDDWIWEIALDVYNEEYDPNAATNPTEELTAGKVSGLSIAYCDNDDPDENPKKRDNFIGSVAVPQAHNNDHWINADWFGKLKLVDTYAETRVEQKSAPEKFTLITNYPNPFNPSTTIQFSLQRPARIVARIYNQAGQLVKVLYTGDMTEGPVQLVWDGRDDSDRDLASGLYILSVKLQESSSQSLLNHKMLLFR